MEFVNYIYFGFTSLLLLILGIKRMKIKHISFSWHTGLLYGFPFFPSILLIFSFVIFSTILFTSNKSMMAQAGLFLANSVLTFMISWIFVEKMITGDKLILSLLLPGKQIVLNDIIDYYVSTAGLQTKVTIIYLSHSKTKRVSFVLPSRYLKLLDHLLEPKISTPKKSTLFTQFIHKEN